MNWNVIYVIVAILEIDRQFCYGKDDYLAEVSWLLIQQANSLYNLP